MNLPARVEPQPTALTSHRSTVCLPPYPRCRREDGETYQTRALELAAYSVRREVLGEAAVPGWLARSSLVGKDEAEAQGAELAKRFCEAPFPSCVGEETGARRAADLHALDREEGPVSDWMTRGLRETEDGYKVGKREDMGPREVLVRFGLRNLKLCMPPHPHC